MIHNKNDDLPVCYIGGGESEWGEREIARRHIHQCERVLELGGGAGSVSSIIQQYISDPTKHVVVQPDEREVMFGGHSQLMKNREACNFKYHTIDHILTEEDVPTILNVLGGKPDCLVVDCEDCLRSEYEKNPSLFDEIKQVQAERDDHDKNYETLFSELNLTKKDSYFGCGVLEPTPDHISKGMMCTTEMWSK